MSESSPDTTPEDKGATEPEETHPPKPDEEVEKEPVDPNKWDAHGNLAPGKRDHIVAEIIVSEERYVEQIRSMLDVFAVEFAAMANKEGDEQKCRISHAQVTELFSGLDSIVGLNGQLLAVLHKRAEKWTIDPEECHAVGDVFKKFSHFFGKLSHVTAPSVVGTTIVVDDELSCNTA